MEGLFQHVSHCKDFVEQTDGLKCIIRLTALPCLPYDFANSVHSDSLVQVIRTMTEVAPSETLKCLTSQVNESLAETTEFWEDFSTASHLLSIVEIKGNSFYHT